VPSRVAVGTLLRVPEQALVAPESTAAPTAAIEQSVTDVDQDLLTVADYLVASGQVDQALNLLQSSLTDRGGSPRLQSRFADIGLARVDQLRAERSYAAAASLLDQAAAVVSDVTVAARLQTATLELELGRLLDLAATEQARGDIEAAYATVRQAMELAPTDSQVRQLEQSLREPWTRQLHEEALLAWRSRDIDRSIRIWQRLLDIVPDFEPARVYLARALELRRRLQ
jgi:tetratricopeptide (TPR) repeat protein